VNSTELVVIASFVVAFSLVSRLLERTWISGPMVFVGYGLLMGQDGLAVLELDIRDEQVILLAETTLGLLLFSDAIRIEVTRLRREAQLPIRLLGIGLPLTIAAGTAAAYLLFDISFWSAALIGAVLAPTDAALGQAVVTSPAVPVRIRQTLNVESGLNDGIAPPAVTIFIAFAGSESDATSPGGWVRFAIEQIGWGAGVGVVVGSVGGWLLSAASRRNWVDATFRQLAVLAIATTAVAGATLLDGNSFVAAFVAGVSFGAVARSECPHVQDFVEDLGQLLAMITFVVFGAILVGPSLGGFTPGILLYALISLTLVRMVPVGLSLIGAGLGLPTVGFIGWFGPRGIASIVFGLLVVEEGVSDRSDELFTIVAWTVVLSVVLHGLSSRPAAAAYGRWFAAQADDHQTMPEANVVKHPHRIRRTHGSQNTIE